MQIKLTLDLPEVEDESVAALVGEAAREFAVRSTNKTVVLSKADAKLSVSDKPQGEGVVTSTAPGEVGHPDHSAPGDTVKVGDQRVSPYDEQRQKNEIGPGADAPKPKRKSAPKRKAPARKAADKTSDKPVQDKDTSAKAAPATDRPRPTDPTSEHRSDALRPATFPNIDRP